VTSLLQIRPVGWMLGYSRGRCG